MERRRSVTPTAEPQTEDCRDCGIEQYPLVTSAQFCEAERAAVVVVSQTWAGVHRVNSRVRDELKAKGLLGRTM